MNALKMKRLVPLAAVVAALGGGVATGAQAALLTYNLTTTFSGDTPQNTYTATFDDAACGPDCVRLTMSITGTSTEFIDGSGDQFGWGFNFNSAKDVTTLTILSAGGNDADSVLTEANAFKADGDGNFDFLFQWNNTDAEKFKAGQTSVYDISLTGLTLSDFNFSSECVSGACTPGTFFSAAHIQGTAGTEGSGWIGDGDGDNGNGEEEVPEPGMAFLLGAGLLGLWATRRRKMAA